MEWLDAIDFAMAVAGMWCGGIFAIIILCLTLKFVVGPLLDLFDIF
jgi:hypothetical protein